MKYKQIIHIRSDQSGFLLDNRSIDRCGYTDPKKKKKKKNGKKERKKYERN